MTHLMKSWHNSSILKNSLPNFNFHSLLPHIIKLWPWRCLLTFLFIANRTSTHYHQDWTTKTNLSAKTNCCFFHPNFLLKATFSANWRVRGKISSRRLRILTKTAANFTSLLELPNGTNIVGWVWKSCFRITKRGQNSAGLCIMWC